MSNLYKVTYTDCYSFRTNIFTVVAANEQAAERFTKHWRDMFDTADVELMMYNVNYPDGVRGVWWDV